MIETNFIRNKIEADLQTQKIKEKIVTRFPPEPNGYLHIGHAKSICLNFGLARDYQGNCHLRFDDTNPAKESIEYAQSIEEDVRWLGFQWTHLFYAADYFEKLYQFALQLIQLNKAYVCELSPEETRKTRGTLTEPGQNSPFRNRSIEENLRLFQEMREGKFQDGSKVLRAKIDMASPNLNLRDPVLYRILRAHHYRTQNQWCIYPLYDYAHPLSDMMEGITHSICTLEFEDHRPFYDWVLDTLQTPCHPQQIEFARLNLTYTLLSKRKLLELVEKKIVKSWDDPRMPTLQGLRRRGYTPESIRNFCERIGVTKKESHIEIGLLETCVREHLELTAPRSMAVLRPLKVILENYPDDKTEELEIPNHPNDLSMGTRKVRFSKVLYIEQEDFLETPPPKYFRLSPGKEVRLRSAYFIRCTSFIKDPETGAVTELRCTYDPDTKGGTNPPDGRKVKGTLHWASEADSVLAEVRLYDRLFQAEFPKDSLEELNPHSLVTLNHSRVEKNLMQSPAHSRYQFERQGYFCQDRDSTPQHLIFNRTVSLRDSWNP